MAIGVIWSPPVDRQGYDATRERVFQAAIDKGMTFHAAGEADGGWRIIEVWESRDGLESFIREDLAAAAEGAPEGGRPTPEPDAVFEVHFQGP